MTHDFRGKTALVTGAASGIGLAAAQGFAASGASVMLSDIDGAAVRAAADKLVGMGYRALGIACDVADEAAVKAMVEQTVAAFGRLDAAFNNAGIQSPFAHTADASGDDFDRVAGVNLRGVWNCMKYELVQMRGQESGAIVNCSSMGGLVGAAGRAIYRATKHGVIGLTKSAALEVAAHGIRINAVCPGIIDTPMVADMKNNQRDALTALIKDVPIGRLGRAEEVAAAVLWLCGPDSTFVIGHALVVDGGFTIR